MVINAINGTVCTVHVIGAACEWVFHLSMILLEIVHVPSLTYKAPLLLSFNFPFAVISPSSCRLLFSVRDLGFSYRSTAVFWTYQMGEILSKPVTDKKSFDEDDPSRGLRYGVSSMQGWRVGMEVIQSMEQFLSSFRRMLYVWAYWCLPPPPPPTGCPLNSAVPGQAQQLVVWCVRRSRRLGFKRHWSVM